MKLTQTFEKGYFLYENKIYFTRNRLTIDLIHYDLVNKIINGETKQVNHYMVHNCLHKQDLVDYFNLFFKKRMKFYRGIFKFRVDFYSYNFFRFKFKKDLQIEGDTFSDILVSEAMIDNLILSAKKKFGKFRNGWIEN